MDAVFFKLLNMSITASWLILAVIAARFALKKAPKWMNCALWGLVGLRLLFPLSIESVLSLIPSAETVGPDIMYSQTPGITSGIPAINGAINPVISGSLAPEVGASVNPIQVLTAVSSVIWLIGFAAMLLYAAVSYLWMRRKVRTSIHVSDAVWICDDIKTPFILGIFKPHIYLPSGMDEGTEAYVIAHEKAHLTRRDHWWKPLGFLILSVYWFNPVIWLAYILLCRDIELACDEKVIRGMEKDDMIAYSEALYSCTAPRRLVMVCPLAFGEVGVKERIKTVLNYKKPTFWIIVLAVIACVIVAVCFLTNPQKASAPYEWAHNIVVEDIEKVTLVDSDRPLSQNEIISLVTLLNELTNDDFTENSELTGGTPTYGLIIQTVEGNRYYLNESIAPAGDLELNYGDKLWWIDDKELSAFVVGAASVKKGTLSLNDVITLSGKGEELTWADFNGYSYIETGSGLYIRVYEIDSQYSLMIGGGSTNAPPMYIRLVSKVNSDDYIDIRTEDVEAFIADRLDSASTSTVGGADGPLSITSNGATVMPYQNPLWSHVWDGAGWLAADGMSVSYTLPEIARELPTVTLRDNFEFIYGDNASFSYLSIFDESYDRIYHNVTLDRLIGLPAGMYYVSAVVKVQGEYIAEGKDYEATGYECVFKLIVPNDDPLEVAVSTAIMDHNKNGYHAGDFACESHVILASEGGGSVSSGKIETVTVYAMVLYQEYGFSGATFHEVSGSHIPAVLTFDVSEDGTYTLTEYWTPRDGSYYAPDIREKFPAGSVEDALDTQKYILVQKQNCYTQAVEYGQVDTDAVIGQLLDVITSSPASSSNPGDYIDAHPIEYRELTYYGDYTLRYVFSAFLSGGQTDLRGHIMRSVMDDLIGGEALKLEANNGQEYFYAWREHVERIYAQNDAAYMRVNCPKGWLLLQKIG